MFNSWRYVQNYVYSKLVNNDKDATHAEKRTSTYLFLKTISCDTSNERIVRNDTEPKWKPYNFQILLPGLNGENPSNAFEMSYPENWTSV